MKASSSLMESTMKQTKAIEQEASAQEKLLEGMKAALDEAEGWLFLKNINK